MLFNSYEFILVFLPIVIFTFYILGKQFGHEVAIGFLILASLLFYAWWNPIYIWLILLSMLFNYGIGIVLSSRKNNRITLTIGIAANLALLGYFKYANFFVDTINDVASTSFNLNNIILPLAISFFTFQQIAYLVDTYQHKSEERNFLHYALFVTFFPQLIAGPIVHHNEMMSQFSMPETFKFNPRKMELGLTIFTLGLFKKVILADEISRYASPVFEAASNNHFLTVTDAWVGALSYSFQLYFDFSAYSDMAIGIALMFGIRLPINFMSPYKAVNIIEFWRKWHMTLSRFLRDYLYFPLGGNRKGHIRRYANLMTTMLLGGLWHGAGWTFAFWGGLHGSYLILNHAWRNARRLMGHDLENSSWWSRFISRGLTFIAVVIAWVYFRAESFESANLIVSTMFGLQPIIEFGSKLFSSGSLNNAQDLLLYLSIIIWLLPNTLQWTGYIDNEYEWWNTRKLKIFSSLVKFRASSLIAIIFSALMIYSILNLTKVSEFLYFQF